MQLLQLPHPGAWPVDYANPVNFNHHLNRSLLLWARRFPQDAGSKWSNIADSTHSTDGSVHATTSRTGFTTQSFLTGAGSLAGNGTTGYADFGNPKALQITGSLTVSCLANFNTVSAIQAIWGKRGAGSSAVGYTLELNNTGTLTFTIGKASGSGGWTCTTASTVSSGTWYHLAAVYNAVTATMGLYINGWLNASLSAVDFSQHSTSQSFQINAQGDGSTLLNGYSDSVCVYSTAFTASQVLDLYTNELAGCPGRLRRATSVSWFLLSSSLSGTGSVQAVSGWFDSLLSAGSGDGAGSLPPVQGWFSEPSPSGTGNGNSAVPAVPKWSSVVSPQSTGGASGLPPPVPAWFSPGPAAPSGGGSITVTSLQGWLVETTPTATGAATVSPPAVSGWFFEGPPSGSGNASVTAPNAFGWFGLTTTVAASGLSATALVTPITSGIGLTVTSQTGTASAFPPPVNSRFDSGPVSPSGTAVIVVSAVTSRFSQTGPQASGSASGIIFPVASWFTPGPSSALGGGTGFPATAFSQVFPSWFFVPNVIGWTGKFPPGVCMAYSTSSDMCSRYDVRRLGDLVRDDGTRATPAQLTSPDPVLQTCLCDASGMIDASCLVGGRYMVADLTNLAALEDGHTNQLLVRLNCDLAYGLLLQRRGYNAAEVNAQAPGFDRALKILDRLRDGEMIFDLPKVVNAGAPTSTTDTLSSQITLVSGASRLFGNTDVGNNPPNPNTF